MDREATKAYQRRWEAVAERAAQEQRKTTTTQRWLALNALLRMATALGVRLRHDEQGDEIVRWCWNRLREKHLSRRRKGPQ